MKRIEHIDIPEGHIGIGFVKDGVLFSEIRDIDIIDDALNFKLLIEKLKMSYFYAKGKKEGKWKDQEDFRDKIIV